uniref:HEAT repeat-containing protein 1 n=1 Tax=Strombidium rassoulzadegani TaxID=1082188 RepID=A0A7S3FYX5_9SPIT|mmetsp:Transcript_7872/g.13195  ORF Transcript_7872/g.13195 Transcript_7872/m.13195 type:complete len:176 (+) Transcript_7872:428-955(+)
MDDDTQLALNNGGHTNLKLLFLVCDNIALNFRMDSDSFIQTDIFEMLAEPIVAELLTLLSIGEDNYVKFTSEVLNPLVFEMVDRLNNDTYWIRLSNAILMKTRLEFPWQVRRAALQVILHLFSKMGQRCLVILTDIISFLSESLEDENPDVEFTAKEIVRRVESLTGESIQDYLK